MLFQIHYREFHKLGKLWYVAQNVQLRITREAL